jgi:predicted dehydrogenase
LPEAPVRVGIIGLNANSGQAGRSHVPAIQALPDLTLQGVANRTVANSQEAAQKFGAPLAFNSVDELVSSPEIDLVVVSTPVPSHHELVMKAVAAGKHVLCEWPFGANLAEAVEMRDAAQAKGVVTAIGLQGRGTPDLNQIRDMIADGYVGKVVSATMVLTGGGGDTHAQRTAWWANRKNGANFETIAAAHNLDALRFLLGDFVSIAALARTQFPNPKINETGETITRTALDDLVISAELQGGVTASIHAHSVPVHPTGALLEIHGTDGAIVVRGTGGIQGGGIDVRGARRGEPGLEPIAIDDAHRFPAGTPEGPAANFTPVYRDTAAAILNGAAVTPNFGTATELHRVLDAIERASDTGQRQTL